MHEFVCRREQGPFGSRSRRQDQRHFDIAPGRSPLAILGLLAYDTGGSPRDGRQASRIDWLLAADADSKPGRLNAPKGGSHFTQQRGVTIQVADGQLALLAVLNPVQLIGARLYSKSFAVPVSVYQFSLSVLQGLSERIQFSLCHMAYTPISFNLLS